MWLKHRSDSNLLVFVLLKTDFLLLLHSHEGCCWSCLLLQVSMVVFHCSYQHHYHDVHPSLVAEVPLHPHVHMFIGQLPLNHMVFPVKSHLNHHFIPFNLI